MAIRIEHQLAGIGGLAAYSAGRGRAKERQTRYSLDLLAQKQQLQARREYLAAQQQAALQQRQWEIADKNVANTLKEAAAKQQHDWDMEKFKATEARRTREARAANLTEIPTDLLDSGIRRDLESKRTAIRDMLLSGRWDLENPEVSAKAQELIDSYEHIISTLPKTTPADVWNKDLTYVDEKTGWAYPEFKEGLTPYRGGKRAIDTTAEDKAADAATKQKEKAASDQAAAEKKRQEDLRKEILGRMNSEQFQGLHKDKSYTEQYEIARQEVEPTFPTGGSSGGEDIPEVFIGEDGTASAPQLPPTTQQPTGWYPPMALPGAAPPTVPSEPGPTIPITIGSESSLDPETFSLAKEMALKDEAAMSLPAVPAEIPFDEAFRRAKVMALADETAYERDMARRREEYKARRTTTLNERRKTVTARAQAKSAARKYRLGR